MFRQQSSDVIKTILLRPRREATTLHKRGSIKQRYDSSVCPSYVAFAKTAGLCFTAMVRPTIQRQQEALSWKSKLPVSVAIRIDKCLYASK